MIQTKPLRTAGALLAACTLALLPATKSLASSHQDAPLIVFDPAANTTDVYAFLSQAGDQKYLEVALGVFPFEQPGIGPNKFNFDDNVRYSINVAVGDDVAAGRVTYTYRFRFTTRFPGPRARSCNPTRAWSRTSGTPTRISSRPTRSIG